MTVPDRSTFESIYAGQPPWDIGRPQKVFIDVADKITGSILEVMFGESNGVKQPRDGCPARHAARCRRT
jgi:hypothetical protein